jgi:hypothetical protein
VRYRDRGNREQAVQILEEAIQILESELAGTTDAAWRSHISSELADCYAQLGGLYRRWGLASQDGQKRMTYLQQSFYAYNKGYLEYEAREEYKIASAYNQLNRLVSYLLFEPTSLSDTPVKLPDNQMLSIKKELQHAGEHIRQRLEREPDDVWALMDLALVDLLLDRGTAASAYAPLRWASPPINVYNAALAGLTALASLPLPIAAKLHDAIQLLTGELQQL